MADPIIGKISVGDGATFTPAVSSAGELSWTNNKNLPNPETVDIAQAVVDKKPGWGIPIGYEYFTINPNIPQGSLPLFGGEYSRETYPDLWAWVQEQTGYLKTEIEWQTLSVSNNGNVPYYSDGDGLTTFRVPSLKCWIKGANGTVTEVGSYLAAGLPNITGYIRTLNTPAGTGNPGAFNVQDETWSVKNVQDITGTAAFQSANFSASRSNSIYGKSSTVQPESIVGMWLVKAYGTVVDTGQIDEQQYIDDRIAALPTSLATTFLPLAGGTMTGKILGTSGVLGNANDTDKMFILGGTSTTDSPSIMMSPKNGEDGGVIQLQARKGSTFANLNAFSNGLLTWDGNEVVTKKDKTIPFTMTTNNGTAGSLSAHKIGNIVVVNFAITPSSNVGVGGSITGTFSGLPKNVGITINSASYVGATVLILSASYTQYTIRVTGATLSSGSGFGMSFMYATVN